MAARIAPRGEHESALRLAALTVTGGRMGDLFGRKRMFKLGAVVFVAGAVTASAAHSFFTLLLGESIIEGIGAALMMPATASLLVEKYRGHDRAIAFGIWGGVAAAASAIGLIAAAPGIVQVGGKGVAIHVNVMICFIVTPQYRDHFRPSRQTDAMPVRPLVDVLLYWFCSVFGGLFGCIALMSLVVRAVEHVAFDRIELLTIGSMTVLAPVLFVIAYRSWRKLNHGLSAAPDSTSRL